MSELSDITESVIQKIKSYDIFYNNRGSDKFSILFMTNNDKV